MRSVPLLRSSASSASSASNSGLKISPSLACTGGRATSARSSSAASSGTVSSPLGGHAQCLAQPRIGDALQHAGRRARGEQTVAQRAQVARGGRAQRAAHGQALDVPHLTELVAQLFAQARVHDQRLDQIQAPPNALDVGQRSQESSPQQTRAHRRIA